MGLMNNITGLQPRGSRESHSTVSYGKKVYITKEYPGSCKLKNIGGTTENGASMELERRQTKFVRELTNENEHTELNQEERDCVGKALAITKDPRLNTSLVVQPHLSSPRVTIYFSLAKREKIQTIWAKATAVIDTQPVRVLADLWDTMAPERSIISAKTAHQQIIQKVSELAGVAGEPILN